MSGGHFSLDHRLFASYIEGIEELIRDNDDPTLDLYGERMGRFYPAEILEKFTEAAATLRRVEKMVRRIDYLVCGDDGPETFLLRWKEEVEGEE